MYDDLYEIRLLECSPHFWIFLSFSPSCHASNGFLLGYSPMPAVFNDQLPGRSTSLDGHDRLVMVKFLAVHVLFGTKWRSPLIFFPLAGHLLVLSGLCSSYVQGREVHIHN